MGPIPRLSVSRGVIQKPRNIIPHTSSQFDTWKFIRTIRDTPFIAHQCRFLEVLPQRVRPLGSNEY